MKEDTATIPKGTTVVIVDEFGKMGAPGKGRRYFGYALSVTKDPIGFAKLTAHNRAKNPGKEVKARDDTDKGHFKVINGAKKLRVSSAAFYIDKENPPRGWKNDKSSESMRKLFTKSLEKTLPEDGKVKVIVDHHTGYRGKVKSIVEGMSTPEREVTGNEYNSSSGPYSDLLQTQDYITYAAAGKVEHNEPSLSDRIKMRFRKFIEGDLE